ncbi:MAG: hypothetical protein L3K14_09035 [Thermoplasmata archaeon]|nr:hypothetical protein [Thermoplasmata archaeon]
MAGDHRARRMTADPATPRRTLDDPSPAPPEPLSEVSPSEVLDAPPAQHAAARLEERQKRWLQLRERALAVPLKVPPPTSEPAENQGSDPKG